MKKQLTNQKKIINTPSAGKRERNTSAIMSQELKRVVKHHIRNLGLIRKAINKAIKSMGDQL